MERINVTLTGTSSLMQHKDTLSNPLHPLTKAHKLLTGKRKKTDEDHEAIAHSEWMASIYHADDIGPYVPAYMLEAAFMNAAKQQKLGTKFKSSVMLLEDRVPLEYTGPRDLEGLWGNHAYVDMRSVKVQTARLQRCRPIFHEWKLSFTVNYNPAIVERQEVIKALEDAGTLIGIGDYRPRYGKFSVSVN